MRHIILFFILLLQPVITYSSPKIIATIKPIHSLISSVTYRVGEPQLLIDDVISIHDYILKPSDARKLTTSDIIFYVDDDLETFVTNIRISMKNKKFIKLSSVVNLLPTRNKYIYSKKDNLKGESSVKTDREEKDLHIWLSPENAKRIVKHVGEVLCKIDSQNAITYQKNALLTLEKINQYSRTIQGKLNSVKDRPYLVTHDAYQYFEQYFNLNNVATLSLNDEISTSFIAFGKIKKMIKEKNIKCIFSESPSSRLNDKISASQLSTQVLDPIGIDIPPGRNAYFIVMQNMADDMQRCLLTQQ